MVQKSFENIQVEPERSGTHRHQNPNSAMELDSFPAIEFPASNSIN